MVCASHCSDPIDLRIENEVEEILKESIMTIANNDALNTINNINILFENIKIDIIDDIYKLSIISNTRKISFTVMASTDLTSTSFPKSYYINLFNTGQKLGTQELVFIINAFFIEKSREEE